MSSFVCFIIGVGSGGGGGGRGGRGGRGGGGREGYSPPLWTVGGSAPSHFYE